MTMLDANDPTFHQQYPNGAIVRDRPGRLVRGVVACDPETGVVIKGTMTEGGRFDIHQVWPAPLTIEPCQWQPAPEFTEADAMIHKWGQRSKFPTQHPYRNP